MDLLVVGGSGLLGAHVVRRAQRSGARVAATFHEHPQTTDADWHPLDLRDQQATQALIEQLRPRMVINCAYRKDDRAITADGAVAVAHGAAQVGAHLVHVSTDVVFSGARMHYDEDSTPDPISAYGRAKAFAETAIAGVAPSAVIARTSLIIADGDSPTEALVHSLTGGAPGVLFTDEVRCPVHAADLADALLELAASARSGIHHVAGADALSRYDLGVLIARRDGLDPGSLPQGRRAAGGPPGPLDVRLDCTRTQAVLRTRLRGARQFLAPPTS